MNENYKKMLLLLSDETIHSIDFCKREMAVTDRTLRSYVNGMNALLSDVAKVQLKRGEGYYLEIIDKKRFNNLLKEKTLAATTNKHNDYLAVIRLFLAEQGAIKKDVLIDTLFLSKASLDSDLVEVKKILIHYGLSLLSVANQGLLLEGKELNKRQLIEDYLYGDIVSEIKDSTIEQILLTNLVDYQLDRLSFNNMYRAAVITLERLRKGCEASLDESTTFLLTTPEYNDCLTLCFLFESHYDVQFDIGDVQYLARALYARTSKDFIRTSQNKLIDQQDMMLAIFEKIELKTGIKVNESMNLALLEHHLEYMIRRSKLGVSINNPLLGIIKKEYPLAWLMAEISGEVLRDQYIISIDDNEKALLATHFGSYIELEKHEMVSDKMLTIVSDKAVGLTYLFMNRLKNQLTREIPMVTVDFKDYQTATYTSTDILLFLDLNESLDRELIQQENGLVVHDLFDIETVVAQIEIMLDVYVPFIHYQDLLLEYLMTEENYYYLETTSYEETLQHVSTDLLQKGIVTEGFYEKLLAKDQAAPTLFATGVSIPHTAEFTQIEETAIYVINLKYPIIFEGQEVTFLFLLLLEREWENQRKIIYLYDEIIQISKKQWMVQEIRQTQSFAEFILVLNKIKRDLRRN